MCDANICYMRAELEAAAVVAAATAKYMCAYYERIKDVHPGYACRRRATATVITCK